MSQVFRTLSVAFALCATVVSAQGSVARNMTFVNSCTKDVWIVSTSGSTGNCTGGAACPAGSSCNTSNNLCFFDAVKPTSGTYRVSAGSSNSIVYPAVENDSGTAWSGNYGFCEDGLPCSADSGTCDSDGCGTNGPSATAEFTLAKNGTDFYDISNIAGVAIPLSIAPAVANLDPNNPYTCGAPGAPEAANGLGPSSWKFTPPDASYQWVIPGDDNTACKADSDCGSGSCGTVVDGADATQVCGQLAGYWSEGALCGRLPGVDVMNCTQAVTNGPFQTTVSEMQGCGGTSGSCYQPGADENCCGCEDWQNTLGSDAVPDSTSKCVNNNQVWDDNVATSLIWLKTGAPSAYTFPYDDFSSTFTCSNPEGGLNTQNYTITLCPGGVDFLGSSS